MPMLNIRVNCPTAIGVALLLIVVASILGYRAVAHRDRLALLTRDFARIQQSNGRERAMETRLRGASADLKAQFFSTMDMSAFNVGNASAAASLMSSRLERLGKHIRDVDVVVLRARSLADRKDAAHIRRDTSIALNRRARVTELLNAMKAVFDDFRANPYASGGSTTELGNQLGHNAYALSKSLRIIAEDCRRAIDQRNRAAASIRREVLRLERAGSFSV
jgi:hypothetical protein